MGSELDDCITSSMGGLSTDETRAEGKEHLERARILLAENDTFMEYANTNLKHRQEKTQCQHFRNDVKSEIPSIEDVCIYDCQDV